MLTDTTSMGLNIAVVFVLRCLFLSLVAFINLIDKGLQCCGLKVMKINMANILRGLPPEARSEAEKPEIAKPLHLFTEAMEKDTSLGLYERIFQIACHRFQLRNLADITEAIADNPDILQTPIVKPIFIVGFPRTGTTLLFNLLAQDPQFKAPMLWELMHPCPAERPDDWRQDARYKQTVRFVESRRIMTTKNLDAVHKLGADLPEECTIPLSRMFLWYNLLVRFRALHEFANWFYNIGHEDLVNRYKHYKRQLQIIGYQRMNGQTMLLKSHNHLLWLDALKEVFPDACFVFTYRKLNEFVPSFCSMTDKVSGDMGPLDDKFSERCLRLLGEMANRVARWMKKHDHLPPSERPMIDFEYSELMTNPLAVVKQIYKHHGLGLTPEVETAMRNYLQINPQNKHGKHKYSLNDFGISKEDLRKYFVEYIDYFKQKSSNII